MTPDDWLIVGFAVTVVLLSLACRWQRTVDNREWERFHAPLTDDSSDLRLDVAMLEAETKTMRSPCAACGFQNFSAKIFCAMCSAPLAHGKPKSSSVATDPLVITRPTRLASHWIRTIDHEGTMVWRQSPATNSNKISWPSFVVRFSEPSESPVESLPTSTTAVTPVLQEPSAADPTAAFSPAWHDASTVNKKHAVRELHETQQQSFPTRVAAFSTRVRSHASATSSEPTTFRLHRNAMLQESIDAIARLSPSQARAPIRVCFVGEPGIDAGGVYREWFSLVTEQLACPETGTFTCVDSQSQHFYLNPHASDALHCLAAGRLVGRALLTGDFLGFHLAPPLLKLILGEPVGFSDLASFDPELHRHLQWLVDNDGADTLALDFTVCEQLPRGETRIVELVADGRDVVVTDDNKRDYVEKRTLHRLIYSVSTQLHAFLHGVYDIVPLEHLVLLNVEELDYVLCGSDELDVDDWERHTRYTQDLWHHPTRRWFWEIVRELSPTQQRRLLQFATGATRVPLVGFRGLTSYDGRLAPFTLVGHALVDEGFVRSHACFNRLDVPRYVNKNHLRRGLEALLATDVHGFSMA